MDHWCRINELVHLPFDVQKEIAIPKELDDGEEVYSSCSYYQQDYSNYSLEDWERLPVIHTFSSIKIMHLVVFDPTTPILYTQTDRQTHRHTDTQT